MINKCDIKNTFNTKKCIARIRVFCVFLRHCISPTCFALLQSHFVILKKAENGESLHRDWMVDSNKTSSLEKVATLSSIVRSELLSKNILHLTVISRTRKIECSYTIEILTPLFSDIVREEERDARGKKFATVKQSTEMTLYLYDISKLISRKKTFDF